MCQVGGRWSIIRRAAPQPWRNTCALGHRVGGPPSSPGAKGQAALLQLLGAVTPSSRPARRARPGLPRGAQQDSCELSAGVAVSAASAQNHKNAGREQRSRCVLCGRRGARAGSPPADPPDVGLRIGPVRHGFCFGAVAATDHAMPVLAEGVSASFCRGHMV